jgi:hypothetical protein
MGRPLIVPPSAPVDRVAALRKVFVGAMRGPGFVADSKKMGLEINWVAARRSRVLLKALLVRRQMSSRAQQSFGRAESIEGLSSEFPQNAKNISL